MTWAPIVVSVVALVVSAMALLINAWQATTARYRLNLDLFEKRHEIFIATRVFISQAATNYSPSSPAFKKFHEKTGPAIFLMGDDVNGYLAKLLKGVLDARKAYARLDHIDIYGESIPGERGKIQDAFSEASAWLDRQHEEAVKIFKPYLSFQNIKSQPLNDLWKYVETRSRE